MSLNPAQVKSLKPTPGKKETRIHDSLGLYLFITDKGHKYWRFKGRYQGKGILLSVGVYPAVSLAEARAKTLELVNLIKSGINPAENRKAQKAAVITANANSFEVVAREWQAVKTAHFSELTRHRIKVGLEKDVFPWLGPKPVDDIATIDLVDIIRRIEARGVRETAHRVAGYCCKVLLYAASTGRRIAVDPTSAVRTALKPLIKNHRSAVTSPAEVGKLLNMIDGYAGTLVVRSALLLGPLTFVRPGELRSARWSDIDFDRKEWRFTASKTGQAHIVPLSRQAIEILKELQPATGRGEFVFPSPASSTRRMSNSAILAAFRRMGITKEEHCGHGWRATARTLLDEELHYSLSIVEMQLAHAVRDVHGTAYNRTTFIKERHEMMQAWADYLDRLRLAATATPVTPARKIAA